MIQLGDFLNDNWDGMMACGVLQRIPKLRKGWSIETSCGQTLSIMEQAILRKSDKGVDHRDAEELKKVLRMFEEHIPDNTCLVISLHLYGKATGLEEEEISKVNFGHCCFILRTNAKVMVVQSFINPQQTMVNDQTSPGKTMSQCQPELHREASDVVQALQHLIAVYKTAPPPLKSSEIKALLPLEWGKYRLAVELLLGYKLPEGIMKSGILNKYRCVTTCLQTADLLEKLRKFSNTSTVYRRSDIPWIHADRLPSQPLSSSAFLSRLFDDNWQSRVVRMRCTLAEASGIEL